MSVFVHAQGIKTARAGKLPPPCVKQQQTSVHVVVEWPLSTTLTNQNSRVRNLSSLDQCHSQLLKSEGANRNVFSLSVLFNLMNHPNSGEVDYYQ